MEITLYRANFKGDVNMKDIYKITNVINGKVYVGQSKNYLERFKQHKRDSRRVNDKRGQNNLYREAREFGWDNFNLELLETCENDISKEIEQKWIDFYKNVLYNHTFYSMPCEDPRMIKQKTALLKQATDKMKIKVSQFEKDGTFISDYEGIREASRITGVCHHTIQKLCKGKDKRKTAGGYIWKYS